MDNLLSSTFWVYVNEGNFPKYLTYGSRGWFPGELTKNRGLEFSVACPNFPGKKEGMEVEPITDVVDLINHSYVMKTPEKSKRKSWERFWVGELLGVQGVACWREQGALCPFPIPYPVNLFHLTVPELYFKLVI